ncbi:MAG: heavy metal-associated domain-containing protein [Phycisphaerales bacterium]
MMQHTHGEPGAGAHWDDARRTHADHSARADLPDEGMSCASCAARIEKRLARQPGAESASVNFAPRWRR